METIENNEIESLLKVTEWPAVSIYLPISRIGDPQDSIRYKNLLTWVEDRLVQEGMRAAEARSLLESEYDLVKNAEYWKHLGRDGLAVFLSRKKVLHYSLPVSFNELATVGKRFQVRPLLSLPAAEQYLILALSQNDLRLFQGDRYHLKEIKLPENTPKSMSETLKYDDPERQLQFRTQTGTAGGQKDAMFHGQGAGADDKYHRLERYFQAVDRCLFPELEEKALPIILAGTEELHAVYRAITKSQTILDSGIGGNVEELALDVLQEKARDIVDEYYLLQEQEVIQNFQNNLGSDKAVVDLESVLTAAFDGRIETLFVAENEQVYGVFDPEKRTVTVKQQDMGPVTNLLDEAVFLTSNTKGTVYVKKLEDMPTDSMICAQLRY